MRTRLCAIVTFWCACGETDLERNGSNAPPSGPGATAEVDVVPVSSQRLDTTTRLPAEIYAYESVALYPRVSGFVEEMLVDRGDRAKKGQLLARLSAPELAAQRAESQSKLAAARSTFLRMQAASTTPGAIAKHDLELADAAAKAEAARLDSLRTLEGYLNVRAPFDGMITERNVHPGALVGPPSSSNAAPMLRMESIGHLRVTVAVPEQDVSAIADGATAEFRVRSWPGSKFAGPIRRVAHAVDARTRTMPVEIDYDNRDGKLAPGMFAEVAWPVRRRAASLLLPVSAIVQTADETFVDRVDHGTVEVVPVERGVSLDGKVEVFAKQLRAGDLILRRGSEELKSGAPVKVRITTDDAGARH